MSLARRLISAGFSDLEKGERFLAAPELEGIDEDALFAGLSLSASPDTALQSLVRLIEKNPGLKKLAAADPDTSEPMYRLLGASEALGGVSHATTGASGCLQCPGQPGAGPSFQRRAAGIAASLRESRTGRSTPGGRNHRLAGLRGLAERYRRGLTELAIKDICAASPTDFMPAVGAELADLAGAAIEAALAVSRAEAAAQFDAAEISDVGLAVIGMGKCGARELNYISDVDVIYVIEAGGELDDARASTIGTALASGISRAISSSAPEPGLWEVDANLRPEGKSGPLVRTLPSHLSYYARWAESWEFQALLKARTIAGDRELGQRYEKAVEPLVWASAGREGFVESVQAMRRRVTDYIPAAEEQRQIKLGRGGLRDVEFTVQLLQLVHGKSDESLRCRDTTSAIAALSAGGYIGRTDAAAFDNAYRYLRLLEHRIQLFQLRRTTLCLSLRTPSASSPRPSSVRSHWSGHTLTN